MVLETFCSFLRVQDILCVVDLFINNKKLPYRSKKVSLLQ